MIIFLGKRSTNTPPADPKRMAGIVNAINKTSFGLAAKPAGGE
ncbi:hypothetical protein RintRC_1464 [Richelia intracellularis]|nr:hypothetical protein RintRC_1464 [Richelia intracellularis]